MSSCTWSNPGPRGACLHAKGWVGVDGETGEGEPALDLFHYVCSRFDRVQRSGTGIRGLRSLGCPSHVIYAFRVMPTSCRIWNYEWVSGAFNGKWVRIECECGTKSKESTVGIVPEHLCRTQIHFRDCCYIRARVTSCHHNYLGSTPNPRDQSAGGRTAARTTAVEAYLLQPT